jgi:hypothetical protein
MLLPRILLLAAVSVAPCLAEDWPGWRGPRGDGASLEKRVPVKWDGAKGEGVL